MMKIIHRTSINRFDALLTAQGMENAGAETFSISYDGGEQALGALIPASRYIVWGRYNEDVTGPDKIDEAIEKELDPTSISE